MTSIRPKDRPHTSAALSAAGRPVTDQVHVLRDRINGRQAVVGVVGQGYVGFPLAQRVAECGFTTLGFDVNDATIARCAAGNRHRKYRAIRSVGDLTSVDVIIIAVPTPTRDGEAGREPDLSVVTAAVHTVLASLPDDRRLRLLILESTYAPGTTRNVVAPIVAACRKLNREIALGYSPERIDPGNTTYSLVNTPKVTSGYDEDAAFLTQLFYSQIVDQAVSAPSLEAAEATKILENTFRFINITFAQEFDQYCEQLGISAREVTRLAATKPFGFMPFYAGAGIGGHCIAEDPYYLHQSMQDAGLAAPILGAAIANHEARAGVIRERIVYRLGGRPIHGARILLLGVSYKPGIGDARRSPAELLIAELAAEGAIVDYHDPYIARFAGRDSVDLGSLQPTDYDLCVVVTDHGFVQVRRLEAAGWRVLDTTNSTVSDTPSPAKRGVLERLSGVTRLLRPRPSIKVAS